MSNFIEMSLECLYDNYRKHLLTEGNTSKQADLLISRPILSRAIAKISYEMLQSSIFQEVYGFSKKQIDVRYLEEPLQGFAKIDWNELDRRNKIVDEHGNVFTDTEPRPTIYEQRKEQYSPLRHLYDNDDNDDDFYEDDNPEPSHIPFFGGIELESFAEADINTLNKDEVELIKRLKSLIPVKSWCYEVINWNDESYQRILSQAEFKVIRKSENAILDELIESHKDMHPAYLKRVSDLSYINLGSSMVWDNKYNSVMGYLDSPIGILTYVQFKHIPNNAEDFALTSTGTCFGYRGLGLNIKIIEGTLNEAFRSSETIIRSSPGANTPPSYTHRLTKMMATVLPVVLPHYASNLVHGVHCELNNRKVDLPHEKELSIVKEISAFLQTKETGARWEDTDIFWKNSDQIKLIIDNFLKSEKTSKKKSQLKAG